MFLNKKHCTHVLLRLLVKWSWLQLFTISVLRLNPARQHDPARPAAAARHPGGKYIYKHERFLNHITQQGVRIIDIPTDSEGETDISSQSDGSTWADLTEDEFPPHAPVDASEDNNGGFGGPGDAFDDPTEDPRGYIGGLGYAFDDASEDLHGGSGGPYHAYDDASEDFQGGVGYSHDETAPEYSVGLGGQDVSASEYSVGPGGRDLAVSEYSVGPAGCTSSEYWIGDEGDVTHIERSDGEVTFRVTLPTQMWLLPVRHWHVFGLDSVYRNMRDYWDVVHPTREHTDLDLFGLRWDLLYHLDRLCLDRNSCN